MASPMDRMLAAVEWTPLDRPIGDTGGIPFATHSGVLHIGEIELRVYQLSDGQRIIAAEDMERFFETPAQAAGESGLP